MALCSIQEEGDMSLQTAIAAQACGLLDLAAETRNRIYEFTLTSNKPIDVAENRKAPPREPPLLATCRQIRQEATGIYYADNIFRVSVEILPAPPRRQGRNGKDAGPRDDWFKRIGLRKTSMIRNCRIRVAKEQNWRELWRRTVGHARVSGRGNYCRGRFEEVFALLLEVGVPMNAMQVEPRGGLRMWAGRWSYSPWMAGIAYDLQCTLEQTWESNMRDQDRALWDIRWLWV